MSNSERMPVCAECDGAGSRGGLLCWKCLGLGTEDGRPPTPVFGESGCGFEMATLEPRLRSFRCDQRLIVSWLQAQMSKCEPCPRHPNPLHGRLCVLARLFHEKASHVE